MGLSILVTLSRDYLLRLLFYLFERHPQFHRISALCLHPELPKVRFTCLLGLFSVADESDLSKLWGPCHFTDFFH